MTFPWSALPNLADGQPPLARRGKRGCRRQRGDGAHAALDQESHRAGQQAVRFGGGDAAVRAGHDAHAGGVLGFGVGALLAGRGELTPCVPFPSCCLFRARGRSRVKDPGFSPAGLAGAAGVLDAVTARR
jgi:hypothetical protein